MDADADGDEFDGDNDYVEIPDDPLLDYLDNFSVGVHSNIL